MGEWLWSVLGFVCVMFAVLKVIGFVWCAVELRRKWRTIPELWGIDWLDIVYRIQREFRVTITAADFGDLPPAGRTALTAGQLWELVAARLRAAGTEPPSDGWERIKVVLWEALNVKPGRILPESRLYADLGMVWGME